jgi:arylsulfatase
MHSKEVTVAEMLKSKGYATACFGKWDLAGHRQKGFHADLMPNQQGFDYFFGTPTSNDRVVDLYRNGKLIEEAADMNDLTRRYTDEALGFIRRNRDKPFFVYLAHTMPHTELGVSPEFRGKSPRGLYGDVIEEIDHTVGRILDTLSNLDAMNRTYVLLTSDNGPWLMKNKDFEDGRRSADHGGSAGPLRSGKVSTWEGGVRVPAVFWAPGRIPAGTVCDKLASTLDVLPTFAKLAGAGVPTDRVIDGEDITHLLAGKFNRADPDKFYCYYLLTELQALRQGKWKLHLPHPAGLPWLGAEVPNRHIAPDDNIDVFEPMLFDLEADVGETTNVAGQHPEVVERLLRLAETVRQDVGDNDHTGKNMRFFDPPDKRPETPLIKFRSEIGPPKR